MFMVQQKKFLKNLLKEFNIKAIFYNPDNFEDLKIKLQKKQK